MYFGGVKNLPRILRLWVEAVRGLERPATSALEAYLLPNDDPRVVTAREAMAKKEVLVEYPKAPIVFVSYASDVPSLLVV